MDDGRVESPFPLPDDRGETTFGIAPVPERFADPAGRLPESRADWPIPGADARVGVA